MFVMHNGKTVKLNLSIYEARVLAEEIIDAVTWADVTNHFQGIADLFNFLNECEETK